MNFSTIEKGKRLKAHYQQSTEQFQAWCDSGYDYRNKPAHIPLPTDLQDMSCGARTKATGNPCKRKDIYSNGRCKLHAGCSTGLRTDPGKKKSSLNGFKKGWRKLVAQNNGTTIQTPREPDKTCHYEVSRDDIINSARKVIIYVRKMTIHKDDRPLS